MGSARTVGERSSGSESDLNVPTAIDINAGVGSIGAGSIGAGSIGVGSIGIGSIGMGSIGMGGIGIAEGRCLPENPGP